MSAVTEVAYLAAPDWLFRVFEQGGEERYGSDDSPYLVLDDLDLALHTGCGSLFVGSGGWDRSAKEDVDPVCPACFNTSCTVCGRAHFDPAIESGDPDDADPTCSSCWDAVMARD